MFEIMKNYGETFSQNWWIELFNVVFRIFDNMKLPDTQIEVRRASHVVFFSSLTLLRWRKLNGWQPRAIMLYTPSWMSSLSSMTISPNLWSTICTLNWNGVSTKVMEQRQTARMIFTWICLDNEILAKSGTNCLENFVISCGQRFTPRVWERTCACILEIFRSTLPETWVQLRRSSIDILLRIRF